MAIGKLLTVAEVADILGVSWRHARRLIADGDLPAVNCGKRAIRIREADLEEMMKRNAVKLGGNP